MHARRGFEEAREIAEGKAKKPPAEVPNSPAARARIAFDYYRQIYSIEREIKPLSPAEKRTARHTRTAPIMAAFKDWREA